MRSRTTPIRSACVKRSNESGGGRIIHSLNHTFQTLTPPPARKFAPVTSLSTPVEDCSAPPRTHDRMMCGLFGQSQLAQSALGPQEGEYEKIVCSMGGAG